MSCIFGSFSIGIMVCRCFGLTGKQGRFDSSTLASAFNSDPLVQGFPATVCCARATALRPRQGDQVLRGQLLAVASRALFLTGAPAPGAKRIFSQRLGVQERRKALRISHIDCMEVCKKTSRGFN